MAASTDFFERVYEVVRLIPAGRVLSAPGARHESWGMR